MVRNGSSSHIILGENICAFAQLHSKTELSRGTCIVGATKDTAETQLNCKPVSTQFNED